jgi:hypothetical protein
LLAALLFSSHAFAQSPPQGFNSTGPVAPFGANGDTIMTIFNDKHGNEGVGIGTAQPQTTLDVNGPINLGQNFSTAGGSPVTVTKGQPCSPTGAIAYDAHNDVLVYCSKSGKWSSTLKIVTNTVSCPAGTNPVGPQQMTFCSAPCPAGSNIVTGGCTLGNGAGDMMDSYPEDAFGQPYNGWTCVYGGISYAFAAAYAVCQ